MSGLFHCDESWNEDLEKERQREMLRDKRVIEGQIPFNLSTNNPELQINEPPLVSNNFTLSTNPGFADLQRSQNLEPFPLRQPQVIQQQITKAPTKSNDVAPLAEKVKSRKLSPQDVEIYRKQNNISVYSNTVAPPPPVISFEDSGFPPHILNVINKLNFQHPTPIQAQAWPVALQGVDLIGIAETGTGKTLAFLLPGIVHILKKRKFYSSNQEGNFGFGAFGASILVLAPTRELVLQIYQNIKPFIDNTSIKATVLYGGVPKSSQIVCLGYKPDIIVATPGRLLDLLGTNNLELDNVTYFVMDEADRMLDMGFEFQVREIISYLKEERQTLMWSATWPPEVKNLAKQYSRYKSVYVKIGSVDLKANHNITQRVEMVEEYMKLRRILQILQLIYDSSCKILIFCHTKKRVDILSRSLNREGWTSLGIHGDKTQHERDITMTKFKNGTVNILIATNVASRGLDVKDIKFVINYDFPNQIEEYVHRIGRTARGGSKGYSITFFSASDIKYADDLIEILEESEQNIPSQLSAMSRGKRSKNQSFGSYKYVNNQNQNNLQSDDAFYESFHNFGEEGEDYDEDYEDCSNVPAQTGPQGNQGFGQSSSGFGQSSSGFGQSSSGFGQSSSGFGQSSSGFGQSSSGFGQSSSGFGQSSLGFGQSPSGFGQSSSGFGQSSSGFGQNSSGLNNNYSTFPQSNKGSLSNLTQGSSFFAANTAVQQTTNATPLQTNNFPVQQANIFQTAQPQQQAFSSFDNNSNNNNNNMNWNQTSFNFGGRIDILPNTNNSSFNQSKVQADFKDSAEEQNCNSGLGNNTYRNNFSDLLNMNGSSNSEKGNFVDKLSAFQTNSSQDNSAPSTALAKGNFQTPQQLSMPAYQSKPELSNANQCSNQMEQNPELSSFNIKAANPLNTPAMGNNNSKGVEDPLVALKEKASEYFDQEFFKQQLLAFHENLKKWEQIKTAAGAVECEKKYSDPVSTENESMFNSNRKSLNSTGFEEDLDLSGKAKADKTPKDNADSDKKEIVACLFDSENKLNNKLFSTD